MKKLIGFQMVNKQGAMPDQHYSFEVFPLNHILTERLMMPNPYDWVLIPIHEGDIEEPTIHS